jgi:hypothetical protein
MELIKSINARLDRWEVERCAEDFPPFEKEDFDISTMEDYEDPREEKDASGGVMELIKYINARLDRWEVERCAEDFPPFEEEDFDSSTMEDYEDPREEKDASGGVMELIKSIIARLGRWEAERCAEDFPAFEEDSFGISTMDNHENPGEEEDALSKLMEQVKSLTTQRANLESKDNGENFLVLDSDVLDIFFEKNIEDFVAIETLASVHGEPVVSDFKKEAMVEMDGSLFLHKISHDVFTFGVETEEWGIVPFLQVGEALFPPDFDDYLEEEQQNPTSPFSYQSSQTTYDSYESESELDMLDFQEQVVEPCPLLTKENYHEEINHLSLSGDAE